MRAFGRNSSAFSLIEVMVAIGLFGFVAWGGMSLLKQYIGTTGKVIAVGKDTDLRQFVRNSIDCGKTFADPKAATACSSGGSGKTDILDHSGAVLISSAKNASVLFANKMRMHCTDEGGAFGLWIDHQPMAPDGKPALDPLLSKAYGWDSLTNSIPILCVGSSQMWLNSPRCNQANHIVPPYESTTPTDYPGCTFSVQDDGIGCDPTDKTLPLGCPAMANNGANANIYEEIAVGTCHPTAGIRVSGWDWTTYKCDGKARPAKKAYYWFSVSRCCPYAQGTINPYP